MRVVHDLAQVRPASRAYVTIGVFDGVHRGHQRLVTEMVEAARSTDDLAVALTFDPHPAAVLSDSPPLLLTTMEERVELLAALGLDVLAVLPFTAATTLVPAADFVARLIRYLRLVELWVGPDFALGHRRAGDIPFLRQLGTERGFGVRVVEPLVWEGGAVSSSRVRDALRAGDIPDVTGCLGRPYRLAGVVVHGRGLGSNIGAPTTNLSTLPDRLVPAGGVYACLAHTEQTGTHPAAVNVGVRPTLARQAGKSAPRAPRGKSAPRGTSDEQGLVVEAHLLDFDADLYGQALALDFIARLRDERAFPTLDALAAQIDDDIAQVQSVLRTQNPRQKPGE